MKTLVNRRDFLKAVGLGAAALAAPRWLSADEPAGPNIILIMADDIGYECLGCYGSESYQTPFLDNLAATGMRFDHCYSQPLCTPSRVKIMTGRHNFRNYIGFGSFDFKERTFAHLLKKAGYATCIAGKWQLKGRGVDGPYDAGFDEYCLWNMADVESDKGSHYEDPKIIQNGQWLEGLEGQYGPDVFCDYILDFIQRNQSGPFLVYYPMVLVHGPFCPTPDSADWGLKDLNDIKYFPDMVNYMDKVIGRIAQKLDELALRNDTLVLFTGDNGTNKGITSEMTGGELITGGKGLTTDAGTRVALIANWQGTTPAGLAAGDIVDFSDLLPTLADAAGAALPANRIIDGRSFLPQLRGQTGNPRAWIYCYYQKNPDSLIQRFARDQQWKLYDDGNLFDVPADVLEQNPNPAGAEADAARARLQNVLDFMNSTFTEIKDLRMIADNWLADGPVEADLYVDGEVNFKDFAVMAETWLKQPPPGLGQ